MKGEVDQPLSALLGSGEIGARMGHRIHRSSTDCRLNNRKAPAPLFCEKNMRVPGQTVIDAPPKFSENCSLTSKARHGIGFPRELDGNLGHRVLIGENKRYYFVEASSSSSQQYER